MSDTAQSPALLETAAPTGEPFELAAKDGYALGATRYRAPAPPRARLLVAGATGVPQSFYARFSAYASARGFEVWTFDYRGIGRSKRAPLKGFSASYLDWAGLDFAAAVDAATEDGLPLFVVGHSFGGHALGLAPNHHRIAGAYVFGTGAGWHGWMPGFEKARIWFLWNVVLPPFVGVVGYMGWSAFGMGEDLPLGVYRQWRRWCRNPRYFVDDPDAGELVARCAEVRFPLVAASALDDLWAPPASRDAFMLSAYPNARIERVDLDPREIGKIGHVGYFRKEAEPLWGRALAWIETEVEGLSGTSGA